MFASLCQWWTSDLFRVYPASWLLRYTPPATRENRWIAKELIFSVCFSLWGLTNTPCVPPFHHLTQWNQHPHLSCHFHQYAIHNIGLLLLMFTWRSCMYQPDNDWYISSMSMWCVSPEGSFFPPECWIKWFFSPREKSHVRSLVCLVTPHDGWFHFFFFPQVMRINYL